MRRIVSILILVACVLLAIVVTSWRPRARLSSHACTLAVLDVGQGDAIYLRTDDGQDMLVDGGPGSAVLSALEQVMPLGDTDLQFVVATHPDSDHIAGLPAVLERYTVQSILTTGVQAETATNERWRSAIRNEGAKTYTARAGQAYALGAATVDVVWPTTAWMADETRAVDDRNSTSIVLRITCGGSTVLLTGDAPTEVEEQLLDARVLVRASALKLGHHGSKYSSESKFLAAVQPNIALVSVGANNRYGHPSSSVLERLSLLHIPVRRTDTEGTIILHSDGSGGWK